MPHASDITREYRNIRVVLPDEVLAPPPDRPQCQRYHRPARGAGEPTPFCNSTGEGWRVVDADRALETRLTACRPCFEAVLHHYAGLPDNPVEYIAEDERMIPTADGGFRMLEPRFEEIPASVVVASRSNYFHAPAVGDEPDSQCTSEAEAFRSVEYIAIEGHYQPCSRCFVDDAQPVESR